MTATGATGAANRGFAQRAALGNAKDAGDGFELSRLFGTPTFNFDVNTSDNSISASNVACNMSALFRTGVNNKIKQGFEQTGTFRDVTVRCKVTDGTYRWDYTVRQRIRCGATPTLEGNKQVITDTLARFVGFTNSVGVSGSPTMSKQPDWAGGTGQNTPTPAGSIQTGAFTVNWLGYSGASRLGGPLPGQVNFAPTGVPSTAAHAWQDSPNANASTTVIRGQNLVGITGAAIPVGQIVAEARLLPPFDIDVLVSGVDVVVGVQGTSSNCTWTGEVWVSDAVFNALN